jgi:hypothetical protein
MGAVKVLSMPVSGGLPSLYDFGDHREHIVKVEDVLARPLDSPLVLCLDGTNRCPPEDVGGTHGYAEFLHILQTPRHEEYTNTLSWARGPFDPTAFSISAVNGLLATIINGLLATIKR